MEPSAGVSEHYVEQLLPKMSENVLTTEVTVHAQCGFCSLELLVLRETTQDSAAQIWVVVSVLELLGDRIELCDDSRIGRRRMG